MASVEERVVDIVAEQLGDPDLVASVERSMGQLRLYQLLAQGKESYEAADWDTALSRFEEALGIISGQRDMAASETL